MGLRLRPARVAVAVLVLVAGGAGPGRAQEPPPAEPPPAPGAPAPAPDFEPPTLVQFVQAPYPEAARAAGREAVVTLEILVAPDGTTKDVKVLGSAGAEFDEPAVAAARQFTWTPGRARGKAVAVRVTYEYRFVLEAEPAPTPPPGDPAAAPAPRPGAIRGTVIQRGTRVPLGGVAVAAVPAGTTGAATAETLTDDDGHFELADLPPGAYDVIVMRSRHKRGRFAERVAPGEAVRVRYFLERDDDNPYSTTVEATPLREEVERRVIPIDQATRIPGTRGDALRAIENLPGVARPPFGAGFLIVRGANPEDTGSYIAGHWVPLVYHFGGLTSVVNSDILSRLEFLPGNFSVRYGRAIGAIVDVDVRAPRADRWRGYVELDVIDGGFLVEGPVGRGSLAVAGRRSWIDTVFSAVVPAEAGLDFTQAPVYYDYQVLYATPLAGGHLSAFAFGVSDELRFAFGDPAEFDPLFRGDVKTRTGVNRLHLTWRRPLGARTELFLSAATGLGALDFSVGPGVYFKGRFFFNSYRAEVTHRPFAGVRVSAGTEGQLYPYSVDVSSPRPPSEGEVMGPPSAEELLVVSEDDVEWTPALYAEAELDLGAGLTLTPGTRLDHYRIAGEMAVNPRLNARWRSPAGTHQVRAGLGRFSQPPQPFETAKDFGNRRVDPEHAVHLSAGYDVQLTRPLRLETTAYYKWVSDLIVGDATLSLRADGRLGSVAYANLGAGRVYGAEVLLRHDQSKRFFGWISYSLSRSERQDGPGEPFRPFSLDQTHVLTVLGSWRLPARFEFGVRLRYVTGNPWTPILGGLYDADADVFVPIPGQPGSERLADNHQLDVRLDRRWVFDTWMLTAYLDVQNAYNRANPEGYQYSYDYRERVIVSGLPIIPSLGVKGEF